MESEVTQASVPVENRRINYVLIDHENVQPTDLKLLDREDVRLWVFVGAGQTKLSSDLAIQMQAMRERADYVRISGNGSNALDFHIAFYIGQLSREDPRGFFHIISRDTGFDPLLGHLKARKILACRSVDISAMPLFKTTTVKASVQTAPGPPAVSVPKANKLVVIVDKPTVAAKPTAATPTPPKKALQLKEMTAAQRLAQTRLVLGKMTANKPGSLAALKKHIGAQFLSQLQAADVDAIIAALKKAGTLKVAGTKVTYS